MIELHVLLLATAAIGMISAVAGAVSSFLNRKKINEIHVMVNGGLTDKIRAALNEAKER